MSNQTEYYELSGSKPALVGQQSRKETASVVKMWIDK